MSWFYFSNSERRFLPYTDDVSELLERAYCEGKPIGSFVLDGSHKFEVHFTHMKQYARSARGGISDTRAVKREPKEESPSKKKLKKSKSSKSKSNQITPENLPRTMEFANVISEDPSPAGGVASSLSPSLRSSSGAGSPRDKGKLPKVTVDFLSAIEKASGGLKGGTIGRSVKANPAMRRIRAIPSQQVLSAGQLKQQQSLARRQASKALPIAPLGMFAPVSILPSSSPSLPTKTPAPAPVISDESLSSSKPSASALDKMRNMFEMLDVNGDQAVTVVELFTGLQGWGYDIDRPIVEFVIHSFGVRKNALDLKEFGECMQFLLETRSKFQKYDIDKSNTIDLSELKQLLEMLHFDSDIVGSLMKLFDTKSKGSLSLGQVVSLLVGLRDLSKYLGQAAKSSNVATINGPKFHALLRAMNIVASPTETKLFIDSEKVSKLDQCGIIKLMAKFKESQKEYSAKAKVIRKESRDALKKKSENQPLKQSAASSLTRSQGITRGLTQRRIAAIRKLNLSKPARFFSIGNEIEQQIIDYCKEAQVAFTDPDFPTSMTSMFYDTSKIDKSLLGTIDNKWKRPSEMVAPGAKCSLFIDDVNQGDVVQGPLGDNWVASAFGILGQHGSHLARELFVSVHPEYGFYQVKLFKDGHWNLVTVDDRIPVSTTDGRPLFTSCRDESEFWVCIIEKAYAKLYGSYQAIAGAKVNDILVDFTGECSDTLDVAELDSTWETVCRRCDEGHFLGCSKYSEGISGDEQTRMGLAYNRAYGIVRCEEFNGVRLLCLRNPWGKFDWLGRWSDDSVEWTPEFTKHFEADFSDDGTFYMCFEDWSREFNQLHTLQLYPDEGNEPWTRTQLRGQWTKASAGGCTNHATWSKNPQYQFSASHDTPLVVSVVLKDRRRNECIPSTQSTAYPPHGAVLIQRKAKSKFKAATLSPEGDQIVSTPEYHSAREATFEFYAAKGTTYLIMPNTFDSGIIDEYCISIYSQQSIRIKELTHEVPSNIVSGKWTKGLNSGGCTNYGSWRQNPQFALEVTGPEPQKIPIVLEQGEVSNGQYHYAGFYIFKDSDGIYPTLDVNLAVESSTMTNAAQISATFELVPGKYSVLVCTYEPDKENTFTLRALSAKAILQSFPKQYHIATCSGEWREGLNGGCVNNTTTYLRNPRVLLRVPTETKATIVITQTKQTPFGFSLFKDAFLTDHIQTSSFADSPSVAMAMTFAPGHYYILATTFEPGVHQKFGMELYSEAEKLSIRTV